jgi:hypothetical protein
LTGAGPYASKKAGNCPGISCFFEADFSALIDRLSFARLCLTALRAVALQAEKLGRLAQLVEHLVYTERVGGSSPSPPTSLRILHENQAGYESAALRLR